LDSDTHQLKIFGGKEFTKEVQRSFWHKKIKRLQIGGLADCVFLRDFVLFGGFSKL
jgi:hypothetical protein